ncbi:MAG: cytochrome c3 family protein [Deltaproteobacteria bacterium]|nr:cytochrome c3 family protein [Deltaproteobacteria bacterium]
MKFSKNIIWTFGVVACVGLLFAAVRVTNAADKKPYDEDTYGPEKLIVFHTPVPKVTFSHKIHTKDAGLGCDDCHDGIFPMETGTVDQKADFNMKSFAEGKYCGTCHDGDTAFSVTGADNCVSCHTPPKAIVFSKPVKAVVFDHTMHVKTGLDCTDCHSKVFKMKIGWAESQKDFVMAALYKGKYCGACHNGQEAFASNTKCTTCHIGVLGFDRLVGNANARKKGSAVR